MNALNIKLAIAIIPAEIAYGNISRRKLMPLASIAIISELSASLEVKKITAINVNRGEMGTGEQEVIIPAMKEMIARGVQCFGPYPADGFMGSGNYTHFDGILAMYHDQGLAPFKALAMDEGVNFTAGLPIVRTSPAHGTAYDIAGKGIASEDSFRQAVYVAMDVFRNRAWEKEISARPLRKQYYEKRDDSDKLKLDSIEEE
jgi:4-hydroxythreonine-4-phosphate dehydrogenase